MQPFGPSIKQVNNYLTDGSNVKVRVTTQGGKSTVAEPKIVSGSFNRVVDETSSAEITFVVPGNFEDSDRSRDECCQGLENINVSSQELEFEIDGEIAWAGPIQYVSWENGQVTVEASDNTAWWASRVLPSITFLNPRELVDVARNYHDVAMSIDPITGFDLITRPSGEFAETQVRLSDKRTALDAIDELAEFSIDYTALGRSVYITSPSNYPTLQHELKSTDFLEGLKVEQLGPGQGFATRIIAFGESGPPITVQADPATIATYGIIERVVEFIQLTSSTDLIKAAKAYLKTFSSPFYIASVSGAILRPGTPLGFNELLPGSKVYVSIQSTCRPLRQLLRIREVSFDVSTGQTAVSLEPTSAEFGDSELVEVVG